MSDARTRDVHYELAKKYDDPEEIRSLPEIFRYLVTEKEADILLGLARGKLGTAKEVQENTGADLSEVEAALEKAFRVGLLVYQKRDDGEREYGFADIYVDSICGDHRNNVHGERYRQLWVQWTNECIKRRDATHGESYMPAGRIVPIPEVFHEHDTTAIIPYEDAREIIKTSRSRAVGQCPCKFRNSDCEYPMDDVCMMFDYMAERSIERGSHKELSEEQALDALERARKAGLVHMSSEHHYMSSSCGTEFICNCCSCCCAFFEHYFKYPEKGRILSNYYCEVDPEKCTGCGKCIDRCFFSATSIVNGVNVVDRDKCLGCGQCAYVCEQEAKVLRRKKDSELAARPEIHRHFIEPLQPLPSEEARE